MLAASLLCLALTAIMQDEETWAPVLFKEGGFVVELPDVDDQEGATSFQSPYGPGTVYQRLRQGNGMIYDIKRYVSPRPILKGDLERWFNYGREQEVGFGAHGKLVSEKKIQAGAVVGREFLLQKDGSNTTGRAYVKGSTLIILIASSGRANKPLPPQGDRFLDSFAFGTVPSPAGKAAEKAGLEAETRRKAAAPWKVVRIDGERITVEMPGETAGTLGGGLKAPLDRFYCSATNAEGPDVNYTALLFRSSEEGDLAATDEAKALAAARDGAFDRLGGTGKVVADRPISAPAGSGHEYELTIEKRPGTVVKARARAFVARRAIAMVVAVAKAPGKDLPPEADRFFNSLTIQGKVGNDFVVAQPPAVALPDAGNGPTSGMLTPALKLILGPTRTALLLGVGRLVASVGVARPAGNVPPEVAAALARPAEPPDPAPAAAAMPKPSAKKANPPRPKVGPLAAWGVEVDPDGDVAIKAAKESLTIRIPGSPHVLAPERDKMNAPRVLAAVAGDFVAKVRVTGEFQPSDRSTLKGLSSREAGGLILWKDADNYLVFQHRASVGDEGKDNNQAVLEELVDGKKGVTIRQAAGAGPLYLRIERQGSRIAAEFSTNGKRWQEMKPVDTTWAAGDIQVGVVAVSTSTGPHIVTFDGYSVESK